MLKHGGGGEFTLEAMLCRTVERQVVHKLFRVPLKNTLCPTIKTKKTWFRTKRKEQKTAPTTMTTLAMTGDDDGDRERERTRTDSKKQL